MIADEFLGSTAQPSAVQQHVTYIATDTAESQVLVYSKTQGYVAAGTHRLVTQHSWDTNINSLRIWKGSWAEGGSHQAKGARCHIYHPHMQLL